MFFSTVVFLAALAALGLLWLLTDWLTHSLIVLDSKPSGLPDQTETLQNWWGHMKTWPDQQKDNDKDKYKDNDNDKYI